MHTYLHVEVEGIRVVVVALDRGDDVFDRIRSGRREGPTADADLGTEEADCDERKSNFSGCRYTSHVSVVSVSGQSPQYVMYTVVTDSGLMV